MTLQSSEQKKKFIADGTSINKKASVSTFHVEKKPNPKTFSKKGEFSTRQFNSQPFHANRRAFENSSQQAVGNSGSLIQRKQLAVLAMRLNPTKRLPVAHTQRIGLF